MRAANVLWCEPWLEGKARNDSSQFGEDGLIEAAIERYGVQPHCCFEVGAGDGLHLSNTLNLRRKGWSALLIESDPQHYARLVENTATEASTLAVHQTIRPREPWLTPERLGLGVIDIDGQDYHVWQSMCTSPQLMLVEFAYRSESDPAAARFIPEIGGAGQAGYAAIMRLGHAKGYRAIAATPCNLLFVNDA